MKSFLFLLGATLISGTTLSLHQEEYIFYFVPLYVLALYHLYRVNYSKGFFLIFLAEPDKKDSVKVRVGPTELETKDDADLNEDKFLDLFDWKKAFTRRALSWILFASAIYMLFFQLKIEINLETILPILTCMCLMRVIAVGHLLVPLALNLYGALRNISEYSVRGNVALVVYGLLFIICLALIYPSEERLGGKLRDWFKGRWLEVVSTTAILLISFSVAWFLLKDIKMSRIEPEIKKAEIQNEIAKLERLQSSIKNMLGNGLMKDKNLLDKSSFLSEKLKELSSEQEPDPSQWKELLKESQDLDKEYEMSLSSSPTPDLTPELLNYMKNDLTSRGPKQIDKETERLVQNFLDKANNFKGSDGDDLVAEFRELKYGKGGYFNESTEFDHNPVTEEGESLLKEIQKTEEKKKVVGQKLEQNISELKVNPDEGAMAVNKALKEELEKLDSLAGNERDLMKRELEKAKNVQKFLDSKTLDPSIKDKLEKLATDNRHLTNEITPHMNAAEKSKMAEMILKHQKDVENVGREVKDRIASDLKVQESEKSKDRKEKDYSKLMNKILRLMAIGLGAVLILWFVNRLSKKGVKKVRGIPDEVKEELAKELKAISRKNLSPREEVIETYNVFHDGLKTLIFTNETPPSCIVYEGIKAAEPELAESTFTVTETFAKTLYGDRDVSSQELKEFRKDVRKVFSFFEITF